MPCKWHTGGFTYYYRQQALRHAGGDVSKITFEQEGIEKFDALNWRREPGKDWGMMLRERAQQLRDSHQYIRLFYSGGCDSHTMLMAFVNNQIWPDEIVLIRMSLDNSMDGVINREVNDGAIGYLNKIRSQGILPNSVKVNIYDIPAERWYQFLKKNYAGDNIRETDIVEVELRVPQGKWEGCIPELWNNMTSDRCADIVGFDKIRPTRWQNGIIYEPGSKPGWYLTVTDESWTQYEISDIHNGLTKAFYISADYPELVVKAAHMNKRYLRKKLGNNVTNDEVHAYYNNMKHPASISIENDKIRDRFYGVTRNLYSQQFTLGKYIDPDGIRVWDKIMRAETSPDNKILKLYDGFMKEHNNELFKYQGMHGNTWGEHIYVRHYYLGD